MADKNNDVIVVTQPICYLNGQLLC